MTKRNISKENSFVEIRCGRRLSLTFHVYVRIYIVRTWCALSCANDSLMCYNILSNMYCAIRTPIFEQLRRTGKTKTDSNTFQHWENQIYYYSKLNNIRTDRRKYSVDTQSNLLLSDVVSFCKGMRDWFLFSLILRHSFD